MLGKYQIAGIVAGVALSGGGIYAVSSHVLSKRTAGKSPKVPKTVDGNLEGKVPEKPSLPDIVESEEEGSIGEEADGLGGEERRSAEDDEAPAKERKEEAPRENERPKSDPGPKRIPDVGDGDDQELFNRVSGNQIGNRFRDSLIGSKNNREVWEHKMKIWNTNLDAATKDQMSTSFRVTNAKSRNLTTLQNKCTAAYSKQGLNDAPVPRRGLKNGPLQKKQYWADVWTHCGRPTKEMPPGWPK